MTRFATLFLVFLGSAAFAAGPTPKQLLFTNLARDARDRAFSNEVALGHAKVELLRARHAYEQDARLIASQAVSTFEYVDALLRLMQANFEVKHLNAVADELATEEKSWLLQADAEAGKTVSAKSLASLYVQLRERHLALSKELASDAKAFADKMREKTSRIPQMQDHRALSVDETFLLEAAQLEADGLVDLANRHLTESQRLFDEANAELSVAGN